MRRLLIAAAIALPTGVACSSSPPACEQPVTTTTVDLQDTAFAPACVEASGGDTLELVNHDDMPHTYTVKDTDIDVRLDAGASGAAPLSGVAPGTYAVVCTLHPQMTQTLVVT